MRVSEVILAWSFLSSGRFTLAMALRSEQGQFSTRSEVTAMSILTIPIVLFFALRRWIVFGLTIGTVEG